MEDQSEIKREKYYRKLEKKHGIKWLSIALRKIESRNATGMITWYSEMGYHEYYTMLAVNPGYITWAQKHFVQPKLK